MSEELKPCPFCGGKAVIEVIEPHRHIICKMPVYKGGAFIECTECGCAISGETETEATEKWNRRMNDPEKVVKQLEEYRSEMEQFGCDGILTDMIENRPAVEVIERFNYSNVFMYIDPPYVLGTRAGKQYKHEMTDADHEELLKALLQSKAKIMISGYESEMYNDYLNGWEKKQFSSCAEHGKPRMETVWMNYEPDQQMKLNFSEVLP